MIASPSSLYNPVAYIGYLRSILKQISKSITKRILSNSYNETVFNEAALFYNERLKETGYSEHIRYEKPEEKSSKAIAQGRLETMNKERMQNLGQPQPMQCKIGMIQLHLEAGRKGIEKGT